MARYSQCNGYTVTKIKMEHFTNLSQSNLALLMIYSCLALISFLTVRLYFSKRNTKENPLSILQRKLSEGKIDTYEYRKQIRQIQKEEDLKMRSFFLSRI